MLVAGKKSSHEEANKYLLCQVFVSAVKKNKPKKEG